MAEQRPRDDEGLGSRLLQGGAGVTREALKRQLERWHRLEFTSPDELPDEPSLFVTHHGFGGSYDLNIFAAITIIERLTGRTARILAHRDLWKIGAGPLAEALGAVQAGHDSAVEAIAAGDNILVTPGGRHDTVKMWKERDTLTFHGRSGFVALAREVGCPVVPIVTAGAAETIIVLSKGEKIIAKMKRDSPKDREPPDLFPVTISMPWGLSAGTAGILPYLSPPVKFESIVLPAVHIDPDRSDDEIAVEIEADMQRALTELSTGRVPFLGRIRKGARSSQRSRPNLSWRPRRGRRSRGDDADP